MALTLPPNVVQGTIAANAAAVLGGSGKGTTVGVQITGTWTGTIAFQGSIDGVTWVAVSMTPIPTAAAVTSTSANGTWTGTFSGLVFFQAISTAWTTGTATVSINTTTG